MESDPVLASQWFKAVYSCIGLYRAQTDIETREAWEEKRERGVGGDTGGGHWRTAEALEWAIEASRALRSSVREIRKRGGGR